MALELNSVQWKISNISNKRYLYLACNKFLLIFRKRLAEILAYIFIISLPCIHFGFVFKLWQKYSVVVDKKDCSCSCWDTGFKANYETGIGRYHHVYFNINSNTARIWIFSALFFIGWYEIFKYFIKLWRKQRLRNIMAVMLIVDIYPHYYSWWMFFNYWNDDFYHQWNHQMIFTITEISSTVCIISLLDKDKDLNLKNLLFILATAVAHVFSGCIDQFIINLVFRKGDVHQILRDMFLLSSDILHIILCLLLMNKLSKVHKTKAYYLISNSSFTLAVFYVLGFLIFTVYIL